MNSFWRGERNDIDVDVILLKLLRFGENIDWSRTRFMILFDRDLLSVTKTKNIEMLMYSDKPTIYSYLFHHELKHNELLLAFLSVLKDERMCTIIREKKLFHCDEEVATKILHIIKLWPVVDNNHSPFITDFVPIFIQSWILRDFSAKFPDRVIRVLHQKMFNWCSIYRTNILKEKLKEFLLSCLFNRI